MNQKQYFGNLMCNISNFFSGDKNIFIGCLLFSIETVFFINTSYINAQNFSDYLWRREITVSNPGCTTLTNYQVRIVLDNTFDFAKALYDGSDIRITDNDQTTILPIWIESWDASAEIAIIWTKVPTIPSTGTTLYLYYGNSTVSSVSDGSATFIFFDDDWNSKTANFNPVIQPTQPWWESTNSYPMVFEDDSFLPNRPRYHMIYDGHNVVSGNGDAKGYAYSSDLNNWIEYDEGTPHPPNCNPILGPDTYNGSDNFAWGDAIKIGSHYYMYPYKFGVTAGVRVESTDLKNWSNMQDLTVTGDPVGIGAGIAILKQGDGITPVIVNNKYWMIYFHGNSPGTMYMAYTDATGDLLHWTSTGTLLSPTSGTWDEAGLFTPSFIKFGNTYYIYYQGLSASVWCIGYAKANAFDNESNPINPNEATWTKSSQAVLIPTSPSSWDGAHCIDPVVRQFSDGKYYLFYTGNVGNGFVTSISPEGPWTQQDPSISNPVWLKRGVPTINNGIISFASSEYLQTNNVYSPDNAMGFRTRFYQNNETYKWGGFIRGGISPYLIVEFLGNELTLATSTSSRSFNDDGLYESFHVYEITWQNSEGKLFIDNSSLPVANITSGVPSDPLSIGFQNFNDDTNSLDIDWVYLRKYNNPDPVATVGSQESNPLFVGVTVNIKVFLQGPYNGSGVMTTALNSNDLIPLSSNDAYSTSVYDYTASTVGNIPNSDIVDWILVELRTETASATKVATRAGFLKKDGTVVDVDGTSSLTFSGISAGNYYVVVRHRNHLAIMSASAILLNSSSLLYDFSTFQSQAYTSGTDPMVALSGGGFGMIASDGNGDEYISASDKNTVWFIQNGFFGYLRGDFNLDSYVSAGDKNLFWFPNNGLATQVP